MKLIDWLLVAVILLLVLLALRSVMKHGGGACSGNCSGCSGCATKNGCSSGHEASAGRKTKGEKVTRRTETNTNVRKKGEEK